MADETPKRRKRHPMLYTADEAATYLACDVATLDTYRGKGWLKGYKGGKGYVYWRPDLDDCADRIVGVPVQERVERKAMKLAE